MNPSLLDRFRGCLLGTMVIRRIQNETITLQDWESIHQTIIMDLIKHETISINTYQEISSNDSFGHSGELILGILPLIVFFHETEFLLLEQLEIVIGKTNIPQENIKEVILFRQIINMIFKQENNLFQKISNLSKSLEKLERFLEQQILLTEIKEQFRQQTLLNSHYLLLSLYCLGRTPDNFKLSILQACQFNHPLILGMTAALSGAYNGYSNIPISWRLTMTLDQKDSLKNEKIAQLWAKWMGVDKSL